MVRFSRFRQLIGIFPAALSIAVHKQSNNLPRSSFCLLILR